MPDLNLLDYLSGDHRNLLEAAPDLSVVQVSQHLSVERDFLYQAIADHVDQGNDIVEDLRHDERELEERLRDYEKGVTPEHRERLQQAVDDHVARQERLFDRLRGVIPESALLTPMEAIALSIGGAPTHAHPRLAEGGPIGDLVEDVTSAADHVRDWLHHDRDPGGG